MRKSKYDPLFFLVFLALYIYYFFIVGRFETTIDTAFGSRKVVAWHGGTLLAPMFATIFYLFYVFGDELENFELKKVLKDGWRKVKVFIREGIEEYRRWRKTL